MIVSNAKVTSETVPTLYFEKKKVSALDLKFQVDQLKPTISTKYAICRGTL